MATKATKATKTPITSFASFYDKGHCGCPDLCIVVNQVIVMAQQVSFLKLKGRIGDLTFYKTKNGHQVRTKGGVSAQRIATDPKFQRTRENNSDFRTAQAAAKHLRDALRPIILFTYDPAMHNRLGSRMLRVVRADQVHVRGEGQVLPENLGILNNFNFNDAASLANTLFEKVAVTASSQTGEVQVTVPALDPKVRLARPVGATHYQFVAGAVALDFTEGGESTLALASTEEHPLDRALDEDAVLSMTLPADAGLPIAVVFGVAFYIEDRGALYMLNNGAYNPMAIINLTV